MGSKFFFYLFLFASASKKQIPFDLGWIRGNQVFFLSVAFCIRESKTHPQVFTVSVIREFSLYLLFFVSVSTRMYPSSTSFICLFICQTRVYSLENPSSSTSFFIYSCSYKNMTSLVLGWNCGIWVLLICSFLHPRVKKITSLVLGWTCGFQVFYLFSVPPVKKNSHSIWVETVRTKFFFICWFCVREYKKPSTNFLSSLSFVCHLQVLFVNYEFYQMKDFRKENLLFLK